VDLAELWDFDGEGKKAKWEKFWKGGEGGLVREREWLARAGELATKATGSDGTLG